MKASHYRDRLPDFPLPVSGEERPTDAPESPPLRGRAEVVSYGDDRRTRGLRALKEITGESGAAVVQGLREVAPDLADWIVDFSYGDVMARPGLDRRTRQLATIAALTALGNAAPQLKVHIEAGLNVGLTREEIVEVIMQMAVYAGFPAALNGLFAAKEVFAQRDAERPVAA
jgi:4-carboxymuconolactone decarboxylase